MEPLCCLATQIDRGQLDAEVFDHEEGLLHDLAGEPADEYSAQDQTNELGNLGGDQILLKGEEHVLLEDIGDR